VRMNFQRKTRPRAKTQAWRAAPGAPDGARVDPVTAASAAPVCASTVDAPEKESTTWVMSSFDLRYGADITDVSHTVPNDLIDELFSRRDEPPKRGGR
jgi:hypothetical protein